MQNMKLLIMSQSDTFTTTFISHRGEEVPKWTSSHQIPSKEEKISIHIFHASFHVQCLRIMSGAEHTNNPLTTQKQIVPPLPDFHAYFTSDYF